MLKHNGLLNVGHWIFNVFGAVRSTVITFLFGGGENIISPFLKFIFFKSSFFSTADLSSESL